MVEQVEGAGDRERRDRAGLRELLLTLAVAAVGCLGAFAVGREAGDPVAFLIWLAVTAPACGFLLGALGVRPWPFAPAAPGIWMAALAWLDVASARDLATPIWSALAWTGLFALGLGLGRLRAPGRGIDARSRALGGAGVLLVIAAALVALPGKGGVADEPWPAATASVLLDLSPATLLVESAGVDWMRHPSVYEPVRTDRFQRVPIRGELAGPLSLVVGYLVAFGAGFLLRSTARASEE